MNNKKELIECKSLLSKIRGLMFRWPKYGAIFINEKPIKYDLHTFFVFYSIDILFLDENYRIIKAYKRVKPFTFYIKGIKSRYIVELRNSKNLNAGEIFKIQCDKGIFRTKERSYNRGQ